MQLVGETETDLRLVDELLSKKCRTEVVDDNTIRLSAGDAGGSRVPELLIRIHICVQEQQGGSGSDGQTFMHFQHVHRNYRSSVIYGTL